MGDFRKLVLYQKAIDSAMRIFNITKSFPREERYALTTQIRNSSRSVAACIAEGYRKRQYPSHFKSKYSDSDMENSESIVWINFSLACEYITPDIHADLISRFEEVGRMLNYTIHHPEKFI